MGRGFYKDLKVERMYRQAYRVAEMQLRRYQQHQSHTDDPSYRRDVHVFISIRRRLAMCARKLGKLKDAIKMMKDLIKEYPSLNLFNIHENLIECYLAAQQYADAQAFLAKYDDIHYPKSATICYTAALLKARQVAEKFSPDTVSRRGLNVAEFNAVEAIHRAVEFNPHVPKSNLSLVFYNTIEHIRRFIRLEQFGGTYLLSKLHQQLALKLTANIQRP